MSNIFKTFLLFFFYISLNAGFAQDIDPLIVMDSAQNKLQKIKSYTADALIEVDVDFLKIQPKHAKVKYEYPNKLDVETEGFSLIPKFGLKPFMKNITKEDNISIFSGREEINGHMCYVIKLLPRVDGKIIMIKLWININNYLVLRSETFTRRSGSYVIDLQYEDKVLPTKLIFSFESEGINIPWKFIGNSIEIDKSKIDDQEVKVGRVTISFSNYVIN